MTRGTWLPRAGARAARRAHVALVAALTVAAAAAGALLGQRLAPERPALADDAPALLRAGDVALPLPAGWTAGAPRMELPGIPEPAGMWSVSADAILAVLKPEDASLLPAGFLDAVGSPPPPRPLPGPVRGWRYDFSGTGLGRLSLVVAPATTGVVTLACQAQAGAPAWATDECVDAARDLQLERGTWLTAAPETAVLLALPRELDRLNTRRGTGRRALARARTAGARARAAGSVAAAYAAAADRLGRLAGTGAAPLAPLLDGLAADHRALGRAHARRDRPAAIRAGASIERREARLGGLLRDLAAPLGR